MPLLTSPSAERVRSVRALARRSVRERRGLFVAEGPQAVREALAYHPGEVAACYLEVGTDGAPRQGELADLAARAGVDTCAVTAEVLAAMADTATPQGALAVCRIVHTALYDVLALRPRLLAVLTHVRDPGNAGTVIRAADAAGADAVLVSDASVDVHNPKAVRATAGSLFHLPVVTGIPAEDLLRQLSDAGLLLLAADGQGDRVLGDPALTADLARPHAWVLGNEAWGLPEHLRAACDAVVRVPVHGRAESLNLAMAATLLLYAGATAQRVTLDPVRTG